MFVTEYFKERRVGGNKRIQHTACFILASYTRAYSAHRTRLCTRQRLQMLPSRVRAQRRTLILRTGSGMSSTREQTKCQCQLSGLSPTVRSVMHRAGDPTPAPFQAAGGSVMHDTARRLQA